MQFFVTLFDLFLDFTLYFIVHIFKHLIKSRCLLLHFGFKLLETVLILLSLRGLPLIFLHHILYLVEPPHILALTLAILLQ